jgi:cell division protein FtsN
MVYFFEQLILAARNRNSDDGGWIQLVVFLVIAVFYGLGNIVKSKAEKRQIEEQSRQKRPGQPRKPQLAYQPAQAAQEARPVSRRPQTGPTRRRPVKSSEQLPPIPTTLDNLAESAVKPLKRIKQAKLGSYEETPRHEPAMRDLINLEDSEALKKAILHYEILGPPVGMR